MEEVVALPPVPPSRGLDNLDQAKYTLPAPNLWSRLGPQGAPPRFTEAYMRHYATAAILADRERIIQELRNASSGMDGATFTRLLNAIRPRTYTREDYGSSVTVTLSQAEAEAMGLGKLKQ